MREPRRCAGFFHSLLPLRRHAASQRAAIKRWPQCMQNGRWSRRASLCSAALPLPHADVGVDERSTLRTMAHRRIVAPMVQIWTEGGDTMVDSHRLASRAS